MNDLRKTGFRFFRYKSCHDCVASTSPRVDRQLFSLPGGPRPGKLGSPSATARFARATASHSIDCPAQAVLGCVENLLVWVQEASRLGYSPNRRELASSRVSLVLDMDLKIQTSRRAKACQQGGSLPTIRPGERHAFTANCSSWVSISRKGVSRDGSGEPREIQIPSSNG